jgi:putative Mg2+ transporter-C (MgtC) family protein
LIATFAAVASLIVLFILGRIEVALQWKTPDGAESENRRIDHASKTPSASNNRR